MPVLADHVSLHAAFVFFGLYTGLSAPGLETLVVFARPRFMIVVVVSKQCIARAFGYDDTEAIWGRGLGSNRWYFDTVHRTWWSFLCDSIWWVVLVLLDVIAGLAYRARAAARQPGP